jgi:hypothetical protein
MRRKISELEEASTGLFDDHHAFLLARMLARIDGIDADIAAVDEQIEAQLAPFAAAAERLDEIPGIGPVAAAIILATAGPLTFSPPFPSRQSSSPAPEQLGSSCPSSPPNWPSCAPHGQKSPPGSKPSWGPPSSPRPDLHAGNRSQDGSTRHHRDRRQGIRHRRTPGLVLRIRAGDVALRHVHPRGPPVQTRQQKSSNGPCSSPRSPR